MLTPKSKASRLDLNACACKGRVLAAIGRYLLILSALSLLTMPITEHLWTWDRFLQTGRDFELGTLMVLSFLCLVLVLSKQCKQSVESLLSRWCALAFKFLDRIFVDRIRPGIFLPAERLAFCPDPVTRPGTDVCVSPLRI
jgi:hypothetical protein